MSTTYRLTTVSCMMGIFVQAVISNLTAILFIPMMRLYGFTYVHLGILVAVNFATQVAADILLSRVIDKKGFRVLVLPTCLISFFGLLLYAAAPWIFPNCVFVGILCATIIFAFSSGMLEVLLSPIIDAIPGTDKGPAMSLMHSFYAWGQVVTIILTTLFVYLVGGEYWQIIVAAWAVVPLVCFFMFLRSPFPEGKPAEGRQGMRELLFRPFYLLALGAIFFGAATEVLMNQWSSAFMEKALALPKLAGDLFGMCGFAVMLGLARLLYGFFGSKIDISKVLILGSLLSVFCYLLVAFSPFNLLNVAACAVCGFFAGLLWPGTLVLSSERYPMAGAWLFAILAVAGDVGASVSSWCVGLVVDNCRQTGFAAFLSNLLQVSREQAAMRIGIFAATVFPLLCFLCHVLLGAMRRKKAMNATEGFD